MTTSSTEALRDQECEIVQHELGQLVSCGESPIRGGVVRLDPLQQGREPIVSLGRRMLDVDQTRKRAGKQILVFDPRDRLVRGDPAIRLPIDADKHVRLFEVGPIEIAGRVRPRTEFEHDRRKPQGLDGFHDGLSLGRELGDRGRDEDTEPLVGRPNRTERRLAHACP